MKRTKSQPNNIKSIMFTSNVLFAEQNFDFSFVSETNFKIHKINMFKL
jgi:hypothetical protein